MLKRTSRLFLRLMGGVVLVLTISSAILIYKDRDTLSWLVNPGANPKTTEVYSQWLDLGPSESSTWDRVTQWLVATEYRAVAGFPTQPGEYRAVYPTLTLFVRPFRYPDKDFPAQLLLLEFSDQTLSGIQAVAGHAALTEWRLEPKRLAEWNAGGKNARAQVRIAELPPYIPGAILAMEDKRFYRHGAFDLVGIARAFWVDLRTGHLRQGASTISQQLARSIFLDVHRTWRRKVLEAALAVYLELRYSKPKLLEMYLNQVYWGQDGADSLLGIEAVSQSLFGKPARALTVAESATLAGMLQSPNRYSPRTTLQAAQARRKIVLGLMRDQKFISESQYKSALGEKIRPVAIKKSNEAAYFLANVHSQLADRYSLPVFLNQGWTIFTTLDPLLQHAAVQAVKPRAGQAALVAIDPKTGGILAWVGGTNFQTNPFDHAMSAKRQPGSAFKPFVALSALESRKVTTATLLEDKPLTLKGSQGSWTPQNYDHHYRGSASVWDSIVYSLNVPMVRLAMRVGVQPIIDVAHRAGIESPLREDLSLALGTSEVSLVELTGAYATLASGGQRNVPYNVQTIVGQDEKVIESHEPSPQNVFAPELTSLVTQMLEGVLDAGTGKAARESGFSAPAAGKTGTSENYQDAWFIGYTSAMVCGVWVGYDTPKSLGHSAAGIALPLWTAFMKKAAVLEPPRPFEVPKQLVWKTIDPESGLLVRSGCPDRRKVAFLSGTEPNQDCPLHPGGLVGFFKRLGAKSPATPSKS